MSAHEQSRHHSESDWLSDHSSPSPTDSEVDYSEDKFSPEAEAKDIRQLQDPETGMHSPPTSNSSTSPPSPTNFKASEAESHALEPGSSKPLASRYPRVFANVPAPPQAASSRPNRIRGMTPMTSISSSTSSSTQHAAGGDYQPRLPKSQPLSRALFARMAPDASHAGLMTGGKKKTSQKLIVPTKTFRTTFELSLSASELARRE